MFTAARPDSPDTAPPRPSSLPSAPQVRSVVVVTASVGAGHDGPAREIVRQLRENGHEAVAVDLVGLAPFGLGRALRRAFRWHLAAAPDRWGAWYEAADERGDRPALLDTVIGEVGRRFAAVLSDRRADVVVSTFPFGGLVVAASQRHRAPVPLVTYVTDPAAHGMWSHPVTTRYMVTAASTAADLWRHGSASVTVVPPAVSPHVRPATGPEARARLRRSLGLPVGPLALVCSGSWGVGDVAQSARDLQAAGVTPVVVCGRNHRVRRRLRDEHGMITVGWTDRMPDLIRACDVVVLNSGGLTLMEAVTSGVPVVHYRPLPGQGQANAAAAERSGLASWPRDTRALRVAIDNAIHRPPRVMPATERHAPTAILEAILGACDNSRHCDQPPGLHPTGGLPVAQ